MIYLDNAAATPIDEKVLNAMLPYFSDKFYNPSAIYSKAREVRADYENAKHTIASLIGAKPAEIIMTAGATESINLAFNLSYSSKSKVLISAVEHKAVFRAATRDVSSSQVGVIKVDKKGRIDFSDLQKQLTDETILISVAYANNEIGVVQDIKKVAEIVNDERKNRIKRGVNMPLLFHTDASQAVGILDINVSRLGVDMMTLSAGKCYGPKQVGLLYIKAGTKLTPVIVGGGQESGLRSGTENVAGTIGFAKAIEIAEKKRKNEVKRLLMLKKDLVNFLQEAIPNVMINGSQKHCLPGLVNFSVPGLDAERVVYALDQQNIQLSTGSACDANRHEVSQVLHAIGLSDNLANASIRLSLGRGNTTEEIFRLKPILAKVIKEQLKFGRSDG